MKLICDFHIHSKYSRATSRDMDLEHLDLWAKIKGINVIGTGDFTHPQWLSEIKTKLEPQGNGLFKLKKGLNGALLASSVLPPKTKETYFILTSEISCIYSKNGRTRKIHLLIFAPDLKTVEKINVQLSWIGNLKSDGRPILGLDAKELAKIVLTSNQNSLVVPAHCLLPESVIHTKNNLLKKIKDIKIGDLVFTHKNRWQKVQKVFRRTYHGKIYHIKPYYFREGLKTTSEHPFYVIKTKKNCHWSDGICKPAHQNNPDCKEKYYKFYKPSWIPANRLEKGDVLIFPRFKNAFNNHSLITISQLLNYFPMKQKNDLIEPIGARTNLINNIIPITKEFCKLAGYYLAEGYTNDRDAIGFAFHNNEKEYIDEVINLVKKVFNFNGKVKIRQLRSKGIEIIFYSKILQQTFAKLFYINRPFQAENKAMPIWMLGCSSELQVEIFKGWWQGDKGYTSSRMLMNQIKIILLRLGIIPSIYKESKEKHEKRGNHYFAGRIIKANHDCYAIIGLSFFEDKFKLLELLEFKQFKRKSEIKHGWIDDNYVYLPIRDIETKHFNGEVYNLEVEKDNSYTGEFSIVHNCWTPWFSLFGSMSGFDSIQECFEEYSKYIFAGETGLSSDPEMNWRLSALDKINLISNSDAHSPAKLGREANIFNCDFSYNDIANTIRQKNPAKFLATIEFFPEEGKYHFDGHRLCGVRLSPEETAKCNGICPKCGRPVTVGVMNRVNKLADRKIYQKPKDSPNSIHLIPLEEIIAASYGTSTGTKAVKNDYENLIRTLNNEFEILQNAPISEIQKISSQNVADGVKRVREGRVKLLPGFDGEYGKILVFEKMPEEKKQISLF